MIGYDDCKQIFYFDIESEYISNNSILLFYQRISKLQNYHKFYELFIISKKINSIRSQNSIVSQNSECSQKYSNEAVKRIFEENHEIFINHICFSDELIRFLISISQVSKRIPLLLKYILNYIGHKKNLSNEYIKQIKELYHPVILQQIKFMLPQEIDKCLEFISEKSQIDNICNIFLQSNSYKIVDLIITILSNFFISFSFDLRVQKCIFILFNNLIQSDEGSYQIPALSFCLFPCFF